jgi:hypothetical protein
MKKYDMTDAMRKDLSGVWRCNFCGLGFPTKGRLSTHVTSRHWEQLKLSDVMPKENA